MADNDTTTGRGAFTQTGDHRPAPGAMNPALGRTSEDLATDSPAGFGPHSIAGTDADLFSRDGADAGSGDESIRETPRKRDPDISPDERMGLRPTIRGDAAPETPVNKDLYGA